MITKCKKCGCDTLIKNGEWYECPMCGTMMFDTSIFVGKIESPTKTLEMIDEGKVTATAQISKHFQLTQKKIMKKKLLKAQLKRQKTPHKKSRKRKSTQKRKRLKKAKSKRYQS